MNTFLKRYPDRVTLVLLWMRRLVLATASACASSPREIARARRFYLREGFSATGVGHQGSAAAIRRHERAQRLKCLRRRANAIRHGRPPGHGCHF